MKNFLKTIIKKPQRHPYYNFHYLFYTFRFMRTATYKGSYKVKSTLGRADNCLNTTFSTIYPKTTLNGWVSERQATSQTIQKYNSIEIALCMVGIDCNESIHKTKFEHAYGSTLLSVYVCDPLVLFDINILVNWCLCWPLSPHLYIVLIFSNTFIYI